MKLLSKCSSGRVREDAKKRVFLKAKLAVASLALVSACNLTAPINLDLDGSDLDEGPAVARCSSETEVDTMELRREFPSGDALQIVTKRSCLQDAPFISEDSEFQPQMDVNPEGGWFVSPGKYSVSFLGEEYLLVSPGPEEMIFAKETDSFYSRPGMRRTMRDGTQISVSESADGFILHVVGPNGISVNETAVPGLYLELDSGTQMHYLLVTNVGPCPLSGVEQVDIVLLDTPLRVMEGVPFETEHGSFVLQSSWRDNSLAGWEIRRISE